MGSTGTPPTGKHLNAAPQGVSVEASGLNARDREILKDIVRAFIMSGEPVSSRSVAKAGRHSLSAATIRNVMADLEDLGYLSQPHTSAGRVPTGDGYHFYIDALMQNRAVPAKARRTIDEALGGATGVEEKMSSASQLLSDLTQQIGIVMTPTVGRSTLRAIDFVNLSGSKILCVLVSAGGFVDNKVIETPEPIARRDLVRISNYLTDHFAGKTLRQIRDELIDLMAEERTKVDRLLGRTIELAQTAFAERGAPSVLVEGTTTVLKQPELSDLEQIHRLLNTFADKATLVRVLNRLIEGPGVRVVIGNDSQLTSELDFSLVATSYDVGDRNVGKVGIFGPSRMDYQRVIPIVEYFGERIGRALEQTFFDARRAEEHDS
ncbi:MAG: heat-inducible transcriptional repressor HrcA [Thermoanaerobaculia bacterium]